MHIFLFIRRFLIPVIIVIALILLALGFYLGRYSVYKAHPELSGQEQASAILSNVGKLIQLPTNETPSIATITDAATVKAQQPFLANAENGDILIVYTTSQTALLYRPSANKLIAVGPVDTAPANPQQVATPPVPEATPTNATTTKAKK